jgi:hypothetical protein
MTEEDARFELLKIELNALQSAIRNLDNIAFQIKGWCVTAALAIGGFAAAYRKPQLLFIGLAASVGFLLVNCQFKAIQRGFIDKNRELDAELRAGIMELLKDGGKLQIVGTAIPAWTNRRSLGRSFFRGLLHELRMPNTFVLYLFILACLTAEAIVLT